MTGSSPQRAIRVLVAEAEGSAPREAGAAMVVMAHGFSGTIGGGALEHEALAAARAMLARAASGNGHRELRAYPLGPALGQCCGGMVRLLFEPPLTDAPASPMPGVIVRPVASGVAPIIVRDRTYSADWPLSVLRAVRQMLSGERPRQTLLIAGGRRGPAYVIEPEARPPHALYLYGAGHVGRAVVRALAELPFAITWVDVAAGRFPSPIPANAVPLIAADAATAVALAPPDALHLVMTFSHPLDLAVVHAVLARPHAWAGLIGSASKRVRFEKRLREAGVAESAIGRLVCPIGIGGITGKEPAMIAVSVAAQLAAWASNAGMAASAPGSSQTGG